MALAFGLLPFAGLRASSEPPSLRRGLELLRRDPLLLLLTLIILLYVGGEIGVSNWIAEYFVQVRGATPAQGAYMVSLLWVGLLVGRLVAAAAYRDQRQAPLLVGASALATGALAAALLADETLLAGACFLLGGVGFAAIYQVVVVIAGQYYRDDQGLAIGAIATGGGLGSFRFPFAMSALAHGLGIGQAFWFCAALSLAMGLTAVLVIRRGLRRSRWRRKKPNHWPPSRRAHRRWAIRIGPAPLIQKARAPACARHKKTGPRIRGTGQLEKRKNQLLENSTSSPPHSAFIFSSARLRSWRTRSRVTPMALPISSSVIGSVSSRPK